MLQVSAQNLQDAVKLTQSERYEDASAAFKNLIKSTPTPDAYYFYADNFVKWELMDSAKSVLGQAVKLYPTSPLIYAGLGKVDLMANNPTAAKANIQKAQELVKADAKTLSKEAQSSVYSRLSEGYIYAESKNADEALRFLTEAEKLNPKDPEIFILKGDAVSTRKTSDASEAIKNYEHAGELDKNSRTSILRQGNIYRAVNNYEAALELYNKAIALDPGFAPAYRERGELYYRSAKIQNGIEDYKKYIELNNSNSARARYGMFLFVAKDYPGAIKELTEVINKGYNNPIAYRVLGFSQSEAKAPAEGLKNVEKFRSMVGPNFKFIFLDYSYYGKLLAANGQDSLGIEELKKAIAIDPEFIDGYSDIASIYFKQKKFPEAAQYYRLKIAKSGKADYNDYNYLGRALYQNKEYPGADSAFTKVTELLPNLTIGYLWSARAKNRQEANPEALTGMAKPMFEKVIAVGSADAEKNKKDLLEAYSYLGYLYILEKNYNCAKAAWTKVKELEQAGQYADKANAAFADKNVAAAAGDCELVKTEQPK